METVKKTKNYNIKLLTERAKHKITQKDLADKAGISRQEFCLIETGQVDPKLTTSMKIARALGVKVEDIFELLF